jgi:FkbM family methyltransferase
MFKIFTKESRSKIFTHRLGRIYYLKHILETLFIKSLSTYANRHLKNNEPQVCLFAFDGIASTINVKGIYEKEQLNTVIGWLQSNGLIWGSFLDIGANIGNHSLYFSKWYDRVFSFEPNPRTFKLLELNADLTDNIKPFNFGISDSNAHVMMQQFRENMGGSRIIPHVGNVEKLVQIEVRMLDSVMREIDLPIGLIKLDIEGHELAALSGAINTISQHRPVILFEQNASDFKNGLSPVIELLKSFGYANFATVMPSPLLPSWIPKLFRAPITAAVRLLMGFDYVICLDKNISPGFYSFVVAIPEYKGSPVKVAPLRKE